MTYKKKLIEVALPLESINAACKKDKDRKTGTIRNLHKWFAPMPVPALRALIFSSLVDDPGTEQRRSELLSLVEQLVESVVETPDPDVIKEARRAMEDSVGDLPVVLDPFCGGGSTLVEAQRLGLASLGSDLNPVPVLISRFLTQLLPHTNDKAPANPDSAGAQMTWHGVDGLESDIDYYATRIRLEAEAAVGDLYPVAPNGDPTIAWFWARTVESPDPSFRGSWTPIVTNWWLSKKEGERAFVEPRILEGGTIEYTVKSNGEPAAPTGRICQLSGRPLPFDYIKEEGREGRVRTDLIARASHGKDGRRYWPPGGKQPLPTVSDTPLRDLP